MDLAQDRRAWSAAVRDAVNAMDADSARAGWMSSQVQVSTHNDSNWGPGLTSFEYAVLSSHQRHWEYHSTSVIINNFLWALLCLFFIIMPNQTARRHVPLVRRFWSCNCQFSRVNVETANSNSELRIFLHFHSLLLWPGIQPFKMSEFARFVISYYRLNINV